MIATYFRTANNKITNRQFPMNTGVSIYGNVTGALGLGEPFTDVRIEVIGNDGRDIYFTEVKTNVWGDFSGYFVTPNYSTKLTVKIIATYSVAGQYESIIPIGVGGVTPDPAPSPQTAGSFLDYIPLVLVVLGGLVLVNLTKKII